MAALFPRGEWMGTRIDRTSSGKGSIDRACTQGMVESRLARRAIPHFIAQPRSRYMPTAWQADSGATRPISQFTVQPASGRTLPFSSEVPAGPQSGGANVLSPERCRRQSPSS